MQDVIAFYLLKDLYLTLKNNANKLSLKLSDGYFLKNAFAKIRESVD
jgi:hypothetical protein